MAKRKHQSGEERQQQTQREQHRPEQNRGGDEAARGEGGVAHDRPDRMEPLSGDDTQRQNTTEDVDDREARKAQDEVRWREGTSRSGSGEP